MNAYKKYGKPKRHNSLFFSRPQRELLNACVCCGNHIRRIAHCVADTKKIGLKILRNVQVKPVTTTTLQNKNQTVTMASKASVRVENESFQIDQQLLFQKLSLLAHKEFSDSEAIFQYELCKSPLPLTF